MVARPTSTKKVAFAFVFATTLLASAYGGQYAGYLNAKADGDDPNANGLVTLKTSRDSLQYNSTLFNAFNVTGVHLHLSPTRGAVYGGPLILALTNTTTAAGSAPVSSTNGALRQNGQKTSADLAANPQLTMVRSTLASLGVNGNNVTTIGDLANLIEEGVVYSDVHTTTRVSPQGLVRGSVYELSCPFPNL